MRNVIIGTLVGVGIAYWAFTEGIISIIQALLLVLLGFVTGYSRDHEGEMQVDVEYQGWLANNKVAVGILYLIIAAAFILASPLFEYGIENWWPIAGAWNLACSVPIIIGAIYLFMSR